MKILIVDEMHPSLFAMLEERNWSYSYQPHITRPEIISQIADYQGLIIRSKTPLDKILLEAATQLQYIGRAGAGIEKIDIAETTRRNIQLFTAPEGNRDTVAEHAIAMLLCLLNKIHTADREVRQKIWLREANRGTELKGKTVGIIGYGNMGKAFAQRLQGFGCQILVFDKYKKNYADSGTKEVTMEEIFGQADVVSFHVPLTQETKTMIDSTYLDRFEKSIYLINTSRGEILVLKDLQRAIDNRKVAGACLDVLENEKMSSLTIEQEAVFEGLAASEKVLFTPHIAGWSHESYIRINEVLVDKIEKWLSSKSDM
ncbi:MAG: phosphoglycerate dehydrogenase [Verrucomicrobia bacterium]|nr:phosphoglycerate dehydrogenase [Cytophagales bacterium]